VPLSMGWEAISPIPGWALVVLLVVQVLNVYKPRGMTPYGQRRQIEERPMPPN